MYLPSAVYSRSINCITTVCQIMCQAWRNFWSYCCGLPLCEETREERRHCCILRDFKAISCTLSHLTSLWPSPLSRVISPWTWHSWKVLEFCLEPQEYGWALLVVWLWTQSLAHGERNTILQAVQFLKITTVFAISKLLLRTSCHQVTTLSFHIMRLFSPEFFPA